MQNSDACSRIRHYQTRETLHFKTSILYIRRSHTRREKEKLPETTSQVLFENGRYSRKAFSYLEIDQIWHLIALASSQWSKISMWLTSPATVAHTRLGNVQRCPCQSLPIANTPCLDSARSLNLTPPMATYSSIWGFHNLSSRPFRHGEAQLRHTQQLILGEIVNFAGIGCERVWDDALAELKLLPVAWVGE
jgi:hypothetical protein